MLQLPQRSAALEPTRSGRDASSFWAVIARGRGLDASKARKMACPKLVPLSPHFLPRWIAQDHIKPGAPAQEHLGKRNGKMERHQAPPMPHAHASVLGWPEWLRAPLPVFKLKALRLRTIPLSYDEVAKRLRGFNGRAARASSRPAPASISLRRGVRYPRKALQWLRRIAEQALGVHGKSASRTP